jgi:hypothetical protein
LFTVSEILFLHGREGMAEYPEPQWIGNRAEQYRNGPGQDVCPKDMPPVTSNMALPFTVPSPPNNLFKF